MKKQVVWIIAAVTAIAAQAQPPQVLLPTGESSLGGYAVRLGSRYVVASGMPQDFFERCVSKKWGIIGSSNGWSLDASKSITLAMCSYVPMIDNDPAVPAFDYQVEFSLNDGEELLAHSAQGKRIRGRFSSTGNPVSAYSTNQGLRTLTFKCLEGTTQQIYQGNYFVVTKSDGQRAVGTVSGYRSVTASQANTEETFIVFEPLLIGNSSFRLLPIPKSAAIFGYPSSSSAAKSLARWVSAEFFELEPGANISGLRKAYRLDKTKNDFDLNGCILAPVSSAMVWSNGQSISRFVLSTRHLNKNDAEPLAYLDALLDAFGEPIHAGNFEETGADVVVLRFKLKLNSELLAGIARDGPRKMAVGAVDIPRTAIVPFVGASESPLPTTRKDLKDACSLLWK